MVPFILVGKEKKELSRGPDMLSPQELKLKGCETLNREACSLRTKISFGEHQFASLLACVH